MHACGSSVVLLLGQSQMPELNNILPPLSAALSTPGVDHDLEVMLLAAVSSAVKDHGDDEFVAGETSGDQVAAPLGGQNLLEPEPTRTETDGTKPARRVRDGGLERAVRGLLDACSADAHLHGGGQRAPGGGDRACCAVDGE